MRSFKNNSGVGAHLVIVVTWLTLGTNALWAKATDALPPPMMNRDQVPPMPPEDFDEGDFPPMMQPPPPRGMPPMRGGDGNNPNFPPGMPPSMNGNGMPPMPPPGGGNLQQPIRGVRGDSSKSPSTGGKRERARGEDAPKNRKNAPNPNEADLPYATPQKCMSVKESFKWNFQEEELQSVVDQVGGFLCRNIVINDNSLKNLKITIIGQSSLTPADSWDILMASLAARGLTLIQQGKVWAVIKKNESKSFSTPMYTKGDQPRNNEAIGTYFYKVQHTSQDVLKNVARSLISKDGLVDSVGDHYIIVIDTNSNIRRLGKIFEQVDIEDAINKVHPIKLKHAEAKTVEKQLRELDIIPPPGQRGANWRAGPGAPKSSYLVYKLIADERTKTLLTFGDKAAVDKLREIVAALDMPATDETGKGAIHVETVSGPAKKIAETLTAIVQAGRGAGRFGRRRDEGASDLFEGEIKITAHEDTNMIVTLASANDYRAILPTIKRLDAKKKQIYVEAAILDISVSDKNKFGIDLFSGLQLGFPNGQGLGMISNPGGKSIVEGIKGSVAGGAGTANLSSTLGSNGIGALAVLGNFLSGGVAGLVGPNIGNTQIPSFGAVLTALSENANVDVLSTPYLLTTDNQQAEMSVGEKVPVVRGASTVGGGLSGGLGGIPIQNVSYEDVKLTFKITPHVAADENVRLEIEQEVNEVGQVEKILNQDQYRIRTKSAKTTLLLKDQQTGIIGGLIHHKTRRTDNKVPFLGDIPILGWLFKKREEDIEARSLALVLTPYIIDTEDDYRKILERKLKEREEFARLYYGGKIKNYNPHIDYSKKPGPLATTLLSVENEMAKPENQGVGEGVTQPKSSKPEEPKAPPEIQEKAGPEALPEEPASAPEAMPEPLPAPIEEKGPTAQEKILGG